MAAKNIRTMARSRTRHIALRPAGEDSNTRRAQLVGKVRAIPVPETESVKPSETDLLLQLLHGLVAQLREAVGRPRLDL